MATRPQRVSEETLAFLAERGPDSSILAGGMSLVPALKQGRLTRKFILNIKRVVDFPAPLPEVASDQLVIGPLVRHRDIETSPLIARHLPILRELEGKLASVQIRNHGTLSGNLCAAEPWSDPPCLIAALDARLLVVSKRGEQWIAAVDWIQGSSSTLQQPDQLLARINIPMPRRGDGVGYVRLAARQGLARPLACAAARIKLAEDSAIADGRVFVGAIGPRPQRMTDVERMLTGNRLDDKLSREIEHAATLGLECLPDERCSASYKKQVAGVLVRRAIAHAVAHAKRAER